VQLKEIVISNLPSPYYHFEYDSAGRISLVSFASGLTSYDVTYDAGHIAQLRNNILVNHDRLVYVYDNAGRVASVQEIDDTGATFIHVILSYNGSKLIGLQRERRLPGGGAFVINKTMSFAYDGDGNLRDLTDHYPAIAGFQDEQTFVDHFEQYDTGINVDAFDLIHNDFFDHLVLLPGVVLQKGNPRRQTRTGDADNLVLDYTYTYDGSNRPLAKSGVVTFTTGPNAGRQFQVGSTFSYY
jgi:hypothetical protein